MALFNGIRRISRSLSSNLTGQIGRSDEQNLRDRAAICAEILAAMRDRIVVRWDTIVVTWDLIAVRWDRIVVGRDRCVRSRDCRGVTRADLARIAG